MCLYGSAEAGIDAAKVWRLLWYNQAEAEGYQTGTTVAWSKIHCFGGLSGNVNEVCVTSQGGNWSRAALVAM